MLRAHREAATSNKKNERILSKKDKRFGIPPSSTTENLLNLSVDHRQTQLVAFGTIFTQGYQQGSKVCFSYVKKKTFSVQLPLQKKLASRMSTDRDWEYSKNCGELIQKETDWGRIILEKRVEAFCFCALRITKNSCILPYQVAHLFKY